MLLGLFRVGVRIGCGVFAIGLGLAACDPGTEPSGGTDTEGLDKGPMADLQRLAEAVCTKSQGCLCHEEVYVDADCETTRELQWEQRFDAATEAGLTFDVDCVDQRIAQAEMVGCGMAGDASAHLCQSFCAPFHGERQQGQSCQALDEVTSDCAQGLLCLTGVCSDPCGGLTGLAIGEPCMTEEGAQFDDCVQGSICSFNTLRCEGLPDIGDPCPDYQCAPGGYCDYDGISGTCAEAAAEGESCGQRQCGPGLSCSWQEGGAEPVCVAPGKLGEPCPDWQCEVGLLCSDGQQCVLRPLEGESCISGQCAEGLLCDWERELCVAPPQGEGQPCPQGVCGTGLWCDQSQDPNGECLPVKALAEPCTGHSQCVSGYCPRGYCLPRPSLGEDCSDTGACASGLVCNGTTCQLAESRGPAVCIYDGL